MQILSRKSLVVVIGAALCTATAGTVTGDEPFVAASLEQMSRMAECSSARSQDQTLHFDMVVHVTMDARSLEVLDTWAEVQDIFIEEWPESQLGPEPGYSLQLALDETI